jgi:hypothetical protein
MNRKTEIDREAEGEFARRVADEVAEAQQRDAEKSLRSRRLIREMNDIEKALLRELSRIAHGSYESADSSILKGRLAVVQDDIENLRLYGREYKEREGSLPFGYKRKMDFSHAVRDYFAGRVEEGGF